MRIARIEIRQDEATVVLANDKDNGRNIEFTTFQVTLEKDAVRTIEQLVMAKVHGLLREVTGVKG